MEKLMNIGESSFDFKKLNLLWMILLTFFTLGAYIGIWFIKNKKNIVNMSAKHGIQFGIWILFTVISFSFLFISLFGGVVLSDYGEEIINSYETIFNYLFVGLHYYSIFRMKEMMEEYLDMDMNVYFLFFFHIFYIQYKINQNHQQNFRKEYA